MTGLNYANQRRTLHLIPFSRVRELYRRKSLRGHWFDEDTMKFFRTVLPLVADERDDGTIYFYTRETNPSGESMYSVRVLKADGEIDTVGMFHSIRTKGAAQDATIAAAGSLS